jgi:hypothetical protein
MLIRRSRYAPFVFCLLVFTVAEAVAQDDPGHQCTDQPLLWLHPAEAHASAGVDYACDPQDCAPPDCFCASTAPPGGLLPAEIPHFVLITYDDCVDTYSQTFIQPVHDEVSNPDGRPVPVTYFVNVDNCWSSGGRSDAQLIHRLYLAGDEIANHTRSHTTSKNTDLSSWIEELTAAKDFLVREAAVPKEHVQGFRAPFLVTNEEMFVALSDLGYLYDSSLMEQPLWNRSMSDGQGGYVWPHTMDFGAGISCGFFSNNPCPDTPPPGMWQLPVYMFTDPLGESAPRGQMYYGGLDPGVGASGEVPISGEPLYEMLMYNFNERYHGNRVPLNLFLHASKLTDPDRRDMMNRYLGEMMAQPDVWAITMTGLIEWMQDPVPASQMTEWYAGYCDRYPCSALVSKEPAAPLVAMQPIVYPNPTGGEAALVFTLPHPETVRLDVLDMLGRLIHRQSAQLSAGEASLQFDLAAQPRGTYVYRLTAGERVISGRIVRL